MNFELKTLTLDSREVAKMLDKNHAHLMRDIAKNIEYLTETKIGLSEFFQENQYKDSTGRKVKRYDITKKGCEFLAHKLTGKKGAIFTASYINKFHEMEQQLSNPKLPFEETKIIPTTWRGKPVMEVKELSKLTGIDRYIIHTTLWENKLTLRHKDFEEYKKENKQKSYGSASSISLLIKEIVIMLCKKYKIYEQHKDFIENYFKTNNIIEYKINTEDEFEHLKAEANKLKQKLLKEQFLIAEKIYVLDKTGLTDQMTVHRNNKNEIVLIKHFN